MIDVSSVRAAARDIYTQISGIDVGYIVCCFTFLVYLVPFTGSCCLL